MPSPRRRDDLLEAWPRGMRDEVAARYVGLGLTTFLREVDKGEAPQPEWLTTGRKVWLKDQLDAWLDRKFGIESDSLGPEPWLDDNDYGKDDPALRPGDRH